MKNLYQLTLATLTAALMSTMALANPQHDSHANLPAKTQTTVQHQTTAQQHQTGQAHKPVQQNTPVQPNKAVQSHSSTQHNTSAQHNSPAQPNKPTQQNQHSSSTWKIQQKLPQKYQNSKYQLTSYQRYKLSQPTRSQQWYKVDGYYLLTDIKTNTIVKIVKA